MENKTILRSEEETTNSTNVTTSQSNLDMAVTDEFKMGYTNLKEVQPHSDQHLSITPVQALTKTPNSNEFLEKLEDVESVQSTKQIELRMRLLSVVEVNSDPQNEKVELMQPPSHPDQDLSATSVQSLKKIANTTSINNRNDLKSVEETKNSITDTTQSIMAMAAVNGSSKLANTKVKELQSHTDQEVSSTLNPFWLNTTNSKELLEILKKIENFKPKEQIEPHPHPITETIVKPGSENKESELKQSPSLVNQEYSETPVQFLTKTTNSVTNNNTTNIISKEETTDSISVTTQPNLEHIKSAELKLHVDQDLSATPVQSLKITANSDQFSEILKKPDDSEYKEQIEPHPRLLLDKNDNPDPTNEEDEFMQPSSSQASDDDSTNSSEDNNPPQQKEEQEQEQEQEPYERTRVTRKSIFIGNVDYSVNVNNLLNVFSVCGSINRVTILNDYVVSRPRGYAFIEFVDVSSVPLSLTLNSVQINGREITVQPKNMNEYGIRSNRRQDIVLNQLLRTSPTTLIAVYNSIMFPRQQITITCYSPEQQNGTPRPVIPLLVQHNEPMPMGFPMPNMYYGMYYY